MHHNRSAKPRWVAALALAAVTTFPGASRADLAGPSLRQLLAPATAVVLGKVAAIATAPDGVTRLTTVAVTDVLAGSAPATIVLAWNARDPEHVSADGGDRLLLMLRPAPSGGPATHALVSPVGGLIQLPPATEPPARAVLQAALANGGDVPLAALLQAGAGSGPHPPVLLVAAALADLSRRVGPPDGAAIGTVACAEPGSYQRAVRLWALEQVGRTGSQAGAACARTLVASALPTKRNPAGGDAVAALAALRGLADDPDRLTASTLNTAVKQAIKWYTFGSEKCAGEVTSLLSQATLSLASTRDVRAASTLYKVAVKRPVRAAASTAVYGLRVLGHDRAVRYLGRLAERHPDVRIRQQALESLTALGG